MIEEALEVHPGCAALNHASWQFDASGAFKVTAADADVSRTFRPKLVVNASGAWVDEVNALLGVETRYIRPVKGAHVLIRNDALFERMAGRAFYFDDGTGRMVISYPLDRTILLGTTEIAVANPSDDTIAEKEIAYLIRSMSSLFDDVEIAPQDVVFMTTGIRPLQAGGSADANRANRDHKIAEDKLPSDTPLVSLIGGKWTTFRAFGEQAADRIFRHLGAVRQVSTEDRDYPGAVGFPGNAADRSQMMAALAARHAITPDRASALLNRYGSIAARVAEACARSADRPLSSLPDFTRNEIAWLVEERAAVHLDDLVFRRSQIALDGMCTPAVLRELGHILADVRGKSAQWAEREIEGCLASPVLCLPAGEGRSEGDRRHG